MNKKAILRSVKIASEAATSRTQLIYIWFQPVQSALSKLKAQWKADNLEHDAYSKKRENRLKRLPLSNQPRLTGYLPLRQTISKDTTMHTPRKGKTE